jgi:hypothetical protein
LPDAQAARRALDESLEAWRRSPHVPRTTPTIRPVMFVDQTRKVGQRLRGFTILRETTGRESYRQFQVKLSLSDPEESVLATYYVFGRGPIWVYRAEDLEMIMHMDKEMMAASAEAAGARPASGLQGAESPPSDASRAEQATKASP